MHDDQISSLIRALEERLAKVRKEALETLAALNSLRGKSPRKPPRISKYLWNIVRELDERHCRITASELENEVMRRSVLNSHYYKLHQVRLSITQMLNAQKLSEDEDKMIGPGPRFWDNAGM